MDEVAQVWIVRILDAPCPPALLLLMLGGEGQDEPPASVTDDLIVRLLERPCPPNAEQSRQDAEQGACCQPGAREKGPVHALDADVWVLLGYLRC